MANLVRTASCGMQLKDSLTFADIERQLQEQTFSLIEPSLVLSHLDNVSLNADDSQRWCQGQLVDLCQAINCSNKISTFTAEHYLVTYQEDKIFLGISILYERNKVLKLKPKIVCCS